MALELLTLLFVLWGALVGISLSPVPDTPAPGGFMVVVDLESKMTQHIQK
jgi:hypothetical protein